MAYNPQNPNGQATSANSSPVVIASDQSAVNNNVITGSAPHNIGFTQVHKDAVYTGTQTSTAIWDPAAGKKFVITDITVTTGGTTAGIVTIYDASGTTAYTASTTPAIFRGEFAPSSTARPGVVKSFVYPYISSAADNNVLVTTSAAINPLYIQMNGYEI